LALQAWIQAYFALDYLPVPTIQVLVDAVAHVMGGNNLDLATRIAGTYINIRSFIPNH
jgi:hypothetical protein